MSILKVIDLKGNEGQSVELDPQVFDGKISHALMHQAVEAYLANQRLGLACTKTRGEVSGGGKKPWRQKGTGRARVGSTRSPIWRHGGVTFGPKPHSFAKDLPKKMKAVALKSALNSKLADKEIIIIKDLTLKSHKTSEFAEILKSIKLDNQKTRFVVEAMENNFKLASRNIEKVMSGEAHDLTTYEALNCKRLVFTPAALKSVEERIKKCLK